jgi:hypothetical protein
VITAQLAVRERLRGQRICARTDDPEQLAQVAFMLIDVTVAVLLRAGEEAGRTEGEARADAIRWLEAQAAHTEIELLESGAVFSQNRRPYRDIRGLAEDEMTQPLGMGVTSVTISAPDPRGLAASYSRMLGWPIAVEEPPRTRVAVWVAVHRHAAPSKADRLRALVQLESIGTPTPRAANAAQLVRAGRPVAGSGLGRRSW